MLAEWQHTEHHVFWADGLDSKPRVVVSEDI